MRVDGDRPAARSFGLGLLKVVPEVCLAHRAGLVPSRLEILSLIGRAAPWSTQEEQVALLTSYSRVTKGGPLAQKEANHEEDPRGPAAEGRRAKYQGDRRGHRVGAHHRVRIPGAGRGAGLSWPLPEDLDDEALEARLFPRPRPSWPGAGPCPTGGRCTASCGPPST